MWPSSWSVVAMSSGSVRRREPSTLWTVIVCETTRPPSLCCISADVPEALCRGHNRRRDRGTFARRLRPAEPRQRLLPVELEDSQGVRLLVQDAAPQRRRTHYARRPVPVHLKGERATRIELAFSAWE